GADVNTEEYPGFATDMQAQYMALATQAEGTSVITETIFENRYLHASEMARMGGNISVEGRRAVVRGPAQLSVAQVRGWCWRAWWPAARRLLIACITSTAGMKGSSKSCALLGLISSAFMPPAHDTAANALLTPGRSYRYFALREGRVRWSNGGRMFQEGMR